MLEEVSHERGLPEDRVLTGQQRFLPFPHELVLQPLQVFPERPRRQKPPRVKNTAEREHLVAQLLGHVCWVEPARIEREPLPQFTPRLLEAENAEC